MKETLDTIAIEHDDDNYLLEYNPIKTWLRDDLVGESSVGDPASEVFQHELTNTVQTHVKDTQQNLRRFDALHYWFDDADDEGMAEGYDIEDDPTGQIAINISRKLRRLNHKVLTNKEVPDWKTVRDNATFINGPAFGDLKHFTDVLKCDLTDNYVHIDIEDIYMRHDRQIRTVLFALQEMERNANKIIEERICETFTTREALDYLGTEQNDKVTRIVRSTNGDKPYSVKERKWFLESRWLTDYLIHNFPKFRRNFDVLIITGAAARINSDDININRIYRLLARLGRVNTRIIFIG